MSVLTTSVAVLTLIVWTYLVFARGSFWLVNNARPVAADNAELLGGVVAIVPARNEAELIGPVIASLLNQTIPLHVFLVNDESTDGTADVARRAAATAGKSDTLTVIQGKPLPSGWTGKLWSCIRALNLRAP
jgi:cellulose synthase/poly-beta-1,6-N-acetylglucosamine synthase-like glycosyltransferase